MMSTLMSPAALGLLRALAARSGVERNRILLSDWRSVDWQSLTFTGERHRGQLRVTGPDAEAVAAKIIDGVGEAEFTIPGQIVADISVAGSVPPLDNGSVLLNIEALTIAE